MLSVQASFGALCEFSLVYPPLTRWSHCGDIDCDLPHEVNVVFGDPMSAMDDLLLGISTDHPQVVP